MKIDLKKLKSRWSWKSNPLLPFLLVVAAVLLIVVLVRTRIEAMNELMATKRIELERCENILASRSGLENVNQTLKRTLTSDEGRFLLRGGTPELVAAKVQSHLIKAAQDAGIRIDNIRYASQGQRKGYKVLSLELTMTTDLEGLLKICELIGSYEEFLFISRAQVTVTHRGDQRILTSKVGISGLMGPYDPQKGPKTRGDSQ